MTDHTYDSTEDTLKHIERVRYFLDRAIIELTDRAFAHDQTKLESPEKEAYDEATPKLRETTYGTPEYFAAFAPMKEAIAHHYAHNSHHPEHEVSAIEEWRGVRDAAGYEVSNLGQVRSIDRTVRRDGNQGDFSRSGQPLSPHLTPKGYHRVQIRVDGKPSNRMVHVLVAEVFLGLPQNDRMQVNHKDGIKQNNRASNLEWMTPSENLQHAYENGLRSPSAKYIVTCHELDIETVGCQKMEDELRARGYPKARAAGIYNAAVGHNTTHLDLTFSAEPIAKAQEYNGIGGMSLLDLIEMLVDWKAASERHADGDFLASIEYNQGRFGYTDEMKAILLNTARELGLGR